MYCCVLTYIGPNHLYLLVVCIKTPFKFSDDQKVFVYYKHIPTNTDQWNEFMCDWICLHWYVCTCIVLYCCVTVLTCIDPYGLYLLVVYLLLYLLVIHMVCIYYTCINIPVYDNLNEYIPILSILPRLVCMCVTVCVSCCILAFLCTSVNNVRIK